MASSVYGLPTLGTGLQPEVGIDLDTITIAVHDCHWLVPSRCQARNGAASAIRLATVDGGGGRIGAYLIPAGLAQPLPVAALTHQALPWLGFDDARQSGISTGPAWSWEAGLPTGSGEHGALILGRPLDEVIILNRAGL